MAKPESELSTKGKILAAAKLHFAEFGLQHASIRAITNLAGVNSALLRYHFGSKDELYREVIESTARHMIFERTRALEALRENAAGGPVAVSSLIEAYAWPVLRNASDNSRDAAIYLRLFGRMYTEPTDALREMTQTQFTDIQKIFIQEIHRSLPDIGLEEVIFRFGLLVGALTFLGSSTGVIEILSDGKIDTKDEKYALDNFVHCYENLFNAASLRR